MIRFRSLIVDAFRLGFATRDALRNGVQIMMKDDDKFNESAHPRRNDGKFGAGAGNSAPSTTGTKVATSQLATTVTIKSGGKTIKTDVPTHGPNYNPVMQKAPTGSIAEKRGLKLGDEVSYSYTSLTRAGVTGAGSGKVYGFTSTRSVETHKNHTGDVMILDEKNMRWQFVQAINVRKRHKKA